MNDKRVYQKLSKDPTPIFKRQLISCLTKVKDKEKITRPILTSLPHLGHGTSPMTYKEGAALHSNVDYIGSMTCITSKPLQTSSNP